MTYSFVKFRDVIFTVIIVLKVTEIAVSGVREMIKMSRVYLIISYIIIHRNLP